AEDGIRDRTVTGVQTCALPISGSASGGRPPPASKRATMRGQSARASNLRASPRAASSSALASSPASAARKQWIGGGRDCACTSRSEERRVGKECRYGGSSYE